MARPRIGKKGIETFLSQYLARMIKENANRSHPNLSDEDIEVRLAMESKLKLDRTFKKWLDGSQKMDIDTRQKIAKAAEKLGWFQEVIKNAPDGKGGFFDIDGVEPLYRNVLFGDTKSGEELSVTLRGMENERKKFKNAKKRLLDAIDVFQQSIGSIKYGTIGHIVHEPGRDTNMSPNTLNPHNFDFVRLRADVVDCEIGYLRGTVLNGLDLLISS